eukprot:1297086-Ditylum_brightwellii.AAC.1
MVSMSVRGKEATKSTLATTTMPNIGNTKEAAGKIQAKIDTIVADISITEDETALLIAAHKKISDRLSVATSNLACLASVSYLHKREQ